jgi:uncharacterized protein involved in exopolysaccharide biosynthesis
MRDMKLSASILLILLLTISLFSQNRKITPQPTPKPAANSSANNLKLSALRKQRDEAQAELNQLLVKYSSEYSGVKEKQEQIDALDKEIIE